MSDVILNVRQRRTFENFFWARGLNSVALVNTANDYIIYNIDIQFVKNVVKLSKTSMVKKKRKKGTGEKRGTVVDSFFLSISILRFDSITR